MGSLCSVRCREGRTLSASVVPPVFLRNVCKVLGETWRMTADASYIWAPENSKLSSPPTLTFRNVLTAHLFLLPCYLVASSLLTAVLLVEERWAEQMVWCRKTRGHRWIGGQVGIKYGFSLGCCLYGRLHASFYITSIKEWDCLYKFLYHYKSPVVPR